MKRIAALVLTLLIFSAACLAAREQPTFEIAECPQFAVSETNISIAITAITAPDTDIVLPYEFMRNKGSITFPAGETRIEIPLSIPVLDGKTALDFSLAVTMDYAVMGSPNRTITGLKTPQFEYQYGDYAVADPGDKVNVYANVKNKNTLAGVYVDFELRDENGNVLTTKKFSRDYPHHPFTFTVPSDWQGNHMVSIWLNDQKLSGDYPVMINKREWPLKRVEVSENLLGISIDCGSGGTWGATRWMDLLDQYDARATFFLTGRWASDNPDAVRDMLARGHELGNHSWHHKDMTKQSYTELRKEIESTNAKIAEITGGYEPVLFRAPYGEWDYRSHTMVDSLGFELIQWSHSSGDSQAGVKPQQVVSNATKQSIGPGCIILFHCDSPALNSMNQVFDYYVKERGLKLVAITDLFPDGETYVDNEGVMRLVN